MFEALSQRFTRIFQGLGGGRLTERNIEEGIQEVRQALLEADVNLEVVKSFVGRVREKAVGLERLKGVKPSDQFVKIVSDEMTALLGGEPARIRWNDAGPTVVMMVGLQGTGKTTTCAKIARHMKQREGKRPLLVAADVQRPAAIEQLKVLAEQVEVPIYAEEGGRPPKICRRGIEKAVELDFDVVLLDTAGRLHIDAALMDELGDVRDLVRPHEIWLVVDAMLGQDAVTSAREFNQRLDVSGLVLTKADGDSRGGAILAVREVTGRPIRYVGVGEKLDKIESFVPERFARRILGMGDVVGLVEQAQQVVDQERAQATAERLVRDQITMLDVQTMLDQVEKMGGMKDVLDRLPGMAKLNAAQVGDIPDERRLRHWKAVIASMTPQERMDPSLLHMQRRHRIARGSGTSVNTVAEVVNAYKDMRRQMKELKKQGFLGKLAGGMMKRQKDKQLKRMKQQGVDVRGWFRT